MVKKSANDARNADEFEQRTKALFDDSVERLDGRTRSRLTRARNAALDELKKSPSRWQWLRSPVAGLAAVTVLAIVIVMWPHRGQTPAESGALPLEDFDIVADAENLEMLQDVEFYVWLEGQAAGDVTNQSG